MSALALINRIRKLQATQRAVQAPALALKAATVTAGPAANLAQWRDDFVGFAAQLDIVDKSGGRTKLRPNAIQTAFEVSRSGRDIVLKPRQVGFTTWELARDVWYFLTRAAAHVVVVVQSSADGEAINEASSKIRRMLESLSAIGVRLDFRTQTATEWVLGDSRLRIVGAGASESSATKKGRGGTIHRLHVTELAFFEFASTTLGAILECVPVGGGSEITIESTANGATGLFFDRWKAAKGGVSGYRPHFFRWMDQAEYALPLDPGETLTPTGERETTLVVAYGATAEQLKWYRAKVGDKGPDITDQEYPIDEDTCFLDGDLQYLPTALVELAAIDPTQIPRIEGESFAGMDIGLEVDLSALCILKADPNGVLWEQETLTCKRTSWEDQEELILRTYQDWEWKRLAMDRSGIGLVPSQRLVRAFGERVEPVAFSMEKKSELATGLYTALAERRLVIRRDADMLRDLKSLRRIITDRGNIRYDVPRNKHGHGDRMWALALAVYAASPYVKGRPGVRTELLGYESNI